MADELVGVLKELSGLLQRLTEQNEARLKREEEFRGRFPNPDRPDFAKMQEEARTRQQEARTRMEETRQKLEATAAENRKRMEESLQRAEQIRQRTDETRDEDAKFKQRVLEEFQRHNQLLETLIAKIGR